MLRIHQLKQIVKKLESNAKDHEKCQKVLTDDEKLKHSVKENYSKIRKTEDSYNLVLDKCRVS